MKNIRCRKLSTVSVLAFLGLAFVYPKAEAQEVLRSAETIFFADAQKAGAEQFGAKTTFQKRSDGRVEVVVSLKQPTLVETLKLKSTLVQVLADHADQIQDRALSENLPKSEKVIEYKDGRILYRRIVKDETSIKAVEREAIGLAHAARAFGRFNHDQLVGSFTGIEPEEISKLRRALFSARKVGSVLTVFPIFNDYERTARDKATTPEQATAIGDSWAVLVKPAELAVYPLQLPSDTIVWHRLGHLAKTISGGYNPALANAQFAQLLENKWVESTFWNRFSPGAMARGLRLSDVIGEEKVSTEVAVSKLNQAFSEGWIIKGTFDWATGTMILTDKLDLVDLVKKYKQGDFLEFLKGLEARAHLMDPDDFVENQHKHPDYRGYRANRFFKYPTKALVQERLRIKKEFRVEIVNGEVLGGDSTVDRYAYFEENPGTFWDEQFPPRDDTPEEKQVKKDVEAFARKVIASLPKALQPISGAFDIAQTESGRFYLIEANPGGNSGYFSYRPKSRRALEKKLRADFVKAKRPGDMGLSLAKQAEIGRAFLKQNGLDIAKEYAGFSVEPQGLLRLNDLSTTAGPSKMLKRSCQDIFR